MLQNLYYKKYKKYKSKYYKLHILSQKGGLKWINDENDLNYNEWMLSPYNMFINQLIVDPPDNLPIMVNYKSIRGQDLIEILDIIKSYGDTLDDEMDFKNLYTNWYPYDDFKKSNRDETGDDRYDLFILTLQLMLFCEKQEDCNSHLYVGAGHGEPVAKLTNFFNDVSNIVTHHLNKYPYTKPLCPFGRKCEYWDCIKNIYKFNQPYEYCVNGNSTGMTDTNILQTSKIIQLNKKEEYSIKAQCHHLIWGHLIPTLQNLDIYDPNDSWNLDSFYNSDLVPRDEHGLMEYGKMDEAIIIRKCKTSEDRKLWGEKMSDNRWRCNYPYIIEFCCEKSGMYYWD